MLNSIETELRSKSLRSLCQTNRFFAKGVLRTLCATDFCLFGPSKANRFSHVAFSFPLDTNEELLECILDCVETLGNEPAKLSITSDIEEANGYSLLISNLSIIEEIIVSSNTITPWQKAGSIFVDLNKDKKQDQLINIIVSKLFKSKSFIAIEKFSYLLL